MSMGDTAAGNLRSFRLQVDGMTSDADAARVADALELVEGVLRAKVSLEAGVASVTLEQSADANLLVMAVEKAGYGVRPEPSPGTASA